MAERRFTFGEILGEAGALLRPQLGFVLGVTALVAAGYIAIDLVAGMDASNVPSIVVGIFVQYLVVERLLAHRMPVGQPRRFGAMFVASLLGGLGILLGLVLLIVPGVVVAAGWMAAAGFVVVEGRGGAAALGASWRATAGSRLPIVLVMLVTYVPIFLVFIGTLVALEGAEASESPVGIVVADLLVSGLGTWGWLLGAAIYNLAVPPDGVAEVFD